MSKNGINTKLFPQDRSQCPSSTILIDPEANWNHTFDGEDDDYQKNLKIPHLETWKERGPRIPNVGM